MTCIPVVLYGDWGYKIGLCDEVLDGLSVVVVESNSLCKKVDLLPPESNKERAQRIDFYSTVYKFSYVLFYVKKYNKVKSSFTCRMEDNGQLIKYTYLIFELQTSFETADSISFDKQSYG
jgi:hypothetical protein